MNSDSPTRPYRQSARAEAAQARGERILDAFATRIRDSWFDEIRLEDVAQDSGVTVQTVIRRFGGKEGLIAAMQERLAIEVTLRREVRPGDVTRAVNSIVEDYEEVGDLILRLLAQEDRYPAVRAMTDRGRAQHRAWITQAFVPWLDGLDAEARQRRIDALVVAGDLYVWKLVRRDMQRSVADYRQLMMQMFADAIGADPAEIFNHEPIGVNR